MEDKRFEIIKFTEYVVAASILGATIGAERQ